MAESSRIEWTDATWTPIRARRADTGKLGVHCEKVSPACKNCYAERRNLRNLPSHGTGLPFTFVNRVNVNIIVDEDMLETPLKWKRPRRIFVCSQTDLFGEFVDDEQIAQVFAVMALAHQHTFQVLTKRPERMAALLSHDNHWDLVNRFMDCIIEQKVDPLERRRDDLRATAPELGPDEPLGNIWLGVTAENQEWADIRMPALARTPAAKRFVSCEPLLGPLDLTTFLPNLDWVIAGGESGSSARPMHPDWARDLQDQCQAWDIPFFFKQWGEWTPGENVDRVKGKIRTATWLDDRWMFGSENLARHDGHRDDQPDLYRVGKKAAGRLLDGLEWNEVPQ